MGGDKSAVEDVPRGSVFLRNTETGEIRTVSTHGEFDELVSQRRDDGVTPQWEQTGEHDAQQHGPVDERVLQEPVETIGDVEGVPDEIEHGGPPVASASDGFDVNTANKAALEQESERRGVKVTGTGKDGNVTADDLRAALR